MNSELKDTFQIQKVLEENRYLDIQRIAQEILTYSKENNVPLKNILEDINTGKPWEYICGYTEFCGNIFKVNAKTLIPRIETEQLVDLGVHLFKKNSFKAVVDVGTGSGCIGISFVKGITEITEQNGNKINTKSQGDVKIYSTDISNGALDIAMENSKNNGTNEYIEYVQTDLIENLNLSKKDEPILFLANLPYIPTPEYLELEKSVKDFEPRLALDGGTSGLELYEKLFKQISKKNIDKFSIVVEIEPKTLKECISLIEKTLPNTSTKVIQDYRNLDRFVLICLY